MPLDTTSALTHFYIDDTDQTPDYSDPTQFVVRGATMRPTAAPCIGIPIRAATASVRIIPWVVAALRKPSWPRRTFGWTADYHNITGVIFCGSLIRPVDVRDGTSHTLMVGEKYINRDSYLNGADSGDNECMYIGDNPDITRWTGPDSPVANQTPPHARSPRFSKF